MFEEHNDDVANSIARMRKLGWDAETITAHIEPIVSRAVLEKISSETRDGSALLTNFHVSLAPGILEMSFSEMVNQASKWVYPQFHDRSSAIRFEDVFQTDWSEAPDTKSDKLTVDEFLDQQQNRIKE